MSKHFDANSGGDNAAGVSDLGRDIRAEVFDWWNSWTVVIVFRLNVAARTVPLSGTTLTKNSRCSVMHLWDKWRNQISYNITITYRTEGTHVATCIDCKTLKIISKEQCWNRLLILLDVIASFVTTEIRVSKLKKIIRVIWLTRMYSLDSGWIPDFWKINPLSFLRSFKLKISFNET